MNPLIKAIAGLLNCTLGDHMDTTGHEELYNVTNNEYDEGYSTGEGPDDYYILINWKDSTVELRTQDRDKHIRTIKFNFAVSASIQP